jgi:hypothetical protein
MKGTFGCPTGLILRLFGVACLFLFFSNLASNVEHCSGYCPVLTILFLDSNSTAAPLSLFRSKLPRETQTQDSLMMNGIVFIAPWHLLDAACSSRNIDINTSEMCILRARL